MPSSAELSLVTSYRRGCCGGFLLFSAPHPPILLQEPSDDEHFKLKGMTEGGQEHGV